MRAELEIGAVIGKGHHAVVRTGKCPIHGPVAIKVFQQLAGESSVDWQHKKSRLLAEGRHLAEAAHNNVVRVHYIVASDTDDAIHLVMECCSAGSLQKDFEKGPLTLSEVLKVATDVCLGLEALHARGKLHRDIKPGNLLRAAGGRIKLGDFGLVTDEIILGYAKGAGYSDHVAYEIWHGNGASVRSDVWALGMTLYRLLHGQEWYSRFPRPQTLVAGGGFADSLKWLPHIPKKWRRVLKKMLHDQTGSRYQTANQVMSALATLPSVPVFACEVNPEIVEWTARMGVRRVVVEWRKRGKNRYEWEAWSEPIAGKAGRRHTLGRSNGEVPYNDSQRTLDAFFEAYY